MARMYPSIVADDTRSPGEVEVFRRLRDDPLTANWAVLHSLNIARHVKRVAGEIDFVILVPTKGILCLEVKAVQAIRRDAGVWYYGTRAVPDPRGPFSQASEGMHSLRKILLERNPAFTRIVFSSAVLFPYVEFNIESPEWHDWQAIDTKRFSRLAMGQLVLEVLEHARIHLGRSPAAARFRQDSTQPDGSQCTEILRLLRPDFELFESTALKREKRESELARYTEEQCEALDAIDDNPRVFLTGPAGTGKTLLALEASRRAHILNRRVLLVCFNRLLGSSLRAQTSTFFPGITTSTLHRHMLNVAGIRPSPSTGSSFWDTELPSQATRALREATATKAIFDELVVDEAQDVLKDPYLDFLDLSIKGGLASGRWRFFGDLERQSIFGSDVDVGLLVATRLRNATRYALRVNCRNTPRVAEYVHILGGLTPRYSRIRRHDDGIEPDIKRYDTSTSQRGLLAKAIHDLTSEGYANEDIVILSSLAEEKGAAATLTNGWLEKLSPLTANRQGPTIKYGSIYAYKGLEAPAIIVTDVDSVSTQQGRALLYVAMTRALNRLVILVQEEAAREMLESLGRLPGGHK